MSKTFVILDGGKLVLNGEDHFFGQMLLEVTEKDGEATVKITTWTDETRETFLADLQQHVRSAKMPEATRAILRRRVAELQTARPACIRCGGPISGDPEICHACYESEQA